MLFCKMKTVVKIFFLFLLAGIMMTGMNMQLYAKEEDDSEAYITQRETTSDLLFDAEDRLNIPENIQIEFDEKTGTLSFYCETTCYYALWLSVDGREPYRAYEYSIPAIPEIKECDLMDIFSFFKGGVFYFRLYSFANKEASYDLNNALAMSKGVTFTYTVPGKKLQTPSKPTLKLHTESDLHYVEIKWDSVPNARGYDCYIYRVSDHYDLFSFSETNDTEEWIKYEDRWFLDKGEQYYFTIVACPDDINEYQQSEESVQSEYLCIDIEGNSRIRSDITHIYPDEITLDKSSEVMYFGGKMTLTPTLMPLDITEKTVTWNSSNPTVATVNNGVVTAKGAGKTIITAMTENNLKATCEVTVYADNNPSNIFADIKYNSWQYNAAKAAYDKGYMTGKGNLNGRVLFDPNSNINRTQFVQALYSMDGKPDITYGQKFSDVKESAWYASAVTWASNNGVIAGNPDGTFSINGKATREQMALMLYKYAVYKKYDVSINDPTTLNNFTDAGKASSWAVTAVKWAVERGIISGKGNTQSGYRIAPTEKATRIECAAMMNKFSEVYSGAPKMGDEDLEEPLALPEENIEDLPVPADETEDVIIDDEEEAEDNDVPSENEKDTDEGEMNPEEELAEDIVK